MFSISFVANETGISAAALRKWEQRYGFPKPQRRGAIRYYNHQQLSMLIEIKRLLNQGVKISKILANPEQITDSIFLSSIAEKNRLITTGLSYLQNSQPDLLTVWLKQQADILGMSAFIDEIVSPLTTLIGKKWAAGQLPIFSEHIYTVKLLAVLNHLIHQYSINVSETMPVMIIGTFQGEKHSLGLAIVETLLANQPIHCINLGTELPLAEFLTAAKEYRANIVGVSFSLAFSKRLMMMQLTELRQQLPNNIAIWIGGMGSLYLRHLPINIQRISSTDSLLSAVNDLPSCLIS